MIRINRNLLNFTILGLFLGVGVLVILSKLIPLSLQKSVYFCQQFVNTFSIKIPNQIGLGLLGIMFVIVLLAVKKFIFTYVEVRRLRSQLILHSKTNKTLGKMLKKLHLQRNVYVVQSENLFAFCYGIRFPKIYVSTSLMEMMSKKELEAILLHERYHLKNRDSLIMLIASLTQLLFPFFPLVTDFMGQYKINREIEADKEAVQKLGDSAPLILVLKKFLELPSPAVATSSAIADYETLGPRIRALVKREKNPLNIKVSHAFISFFSIAIFGTMIITPVYAIEMHMPQQDATMLCLQGDACAKWCKEYNTVVPYSNRSLQSYSPADTSQLYNPAK